MFVAVHQIKQEEWLAVILRERRRTMAVGECNQAKWIQAGLKIAEHLKEIEKISEKYELGYVGFSVNGSPFLGVTADAFHIDLDGNKREIEIRNGKVRLRENGREFYMQA